MQGQNEQSSSVWRPAPRNVGGPGDEVHIWRVCLVQTETVVNRCCAILTEDELARSKRFRFESDQKKFIITRGFLRLILCRYLHREPRLLRFGYGRYGKPALLDQDGECPLQFNLSHSVDLALYAMTDRRAVGIDVESLRNTAAYQEIADRVFSSREAGEIRTLLPKKQREAFFSCWTRKEAYVKARGEGLSFPLDQFEVPLISGRSMTFLSTIRDRESASLWSLYNVPVECGYSAALAVEGDQCGLRFWEYSASGEL